MNGNTRGIRFRRFSLLLAAAILFLHCLAAPAMAAGSRRLVEEITDWGSRNSRVVYSYDGAGKLTQKTEYNNDKLFSSTEYHYYADGTLFEELYRGNILLYFHYDSKGTLIERDETGGIGSPAFLLAYDGSSLRTEYDAAGRITRFEVRSPDAAPYVLTYEYDRQGRILRFQVGSDRTDSFDYRPDGSFTRVRSDSMVTITQSYNAAGLLTYEDRLQGGCHSVSTYEYNAAGLLSRESYQSDDYSWTASYAYDSRGNLSEERFDGRIITTYANSYDDQGNLIRSVRSSGGDSVTTTYRYE